MKNGVKNGINVELIMQLDARNITAEELAKILGVSTRTACEKLLGVKPFYLKDYEKFKESEKGKFATPRMFKGKLKDFAYIGITRKTYEKMIQELER